MALVAEIKERIEFAIEKGIVRFVVFPFGNIGMLVKSVLEEAYALSPILLDNMLCRYNEKIKPLDFLETMNGEEYCLIYACKNQAIYSELKDEILKYVDEERLLEIKSLIPVKPKVESSKKKEVKQITECGKYSYGPLCNHWLVERVGAFCSFASGSDVVQNHPTDYISTHPFLFQSRDCNEVFDKDYNQYNDRKWFFEGVLPQGRIPKLKKITIGNDVWLGKNVIITNGANIGNGVIAAAGTVITNDIPDYAIVAGVPARVIRYRYSKEQINALNRIQWWNWSDDEIRERYMDFYISIEEFIEKYNV